MNQTTTYPIGTPLVAAVMLAMLGFSGGVALSQASVTSGLTTFFPVVASWASTTPACAGVDDGTEERARIALRHATEGDEEAWCLLR